MASFRLFVPFQLFLFLLSSFRSFIFFGSRFFCFISLILFTIFFYHYWLRYHYRVNRWNCITLPILIEMMIFWVSFKSFNLFFFECYKSHNFVINIALLSLLYIGDQWCFIFTLSVLYIFILALFWVFSNYNLNLNK
jgi:hypothetical protein